MVVGVELLHGKHGGKMSGTDVKHVLAMAMAMATAKQSVDEKRGGAAMHQATCSGVHAALRNGLRVGEMIPCGDVVQS